MDNLRVRHADKVREWLEQEERSKKLRLILPAPYSPMLNPDVISIATWQICVSAR
ncbi:hypothetical protein [Plasticicumulans sp.]|uniref:hypothetical protein n=1 Tax=Plasticicumulans sp. TaxID=2307179 RepID=UPI00394DC284